MKITIEGTQKEIADFVLAVQSRQNEQIVNVVPDLHHLSDEVVDDVANRLSKEIRSYLEHES